MVGILLFKKREEKEEVKKGEEVFEDLDFLFPGEEVVDGQIVNFPGRH